jgi:putative DNA methylase
MTYRKKLIEVALPLDAINRESKRDKSLATAHPTTLHYWWAPRPLPACRAIVFASLVDDPSEHPELFPREIQQSAERQRLFNLMNELIAWENRDNINILKKARNEIERYTDGYAPTLYDPFCGRGLIPLEAQRLGLEVIASELNPVAVLITQTLLYVMPKYKDMKPVNPKSRDQTSFSSYEGGKGFALDVKYYANRILRLAEEKLIEYYPLYIVTSEIANDQPLLKNYVGRKLTLIAWLWARTVKCPNPACGATIPLVGQFWLSKKKNRRFWLEPILDRKTMKCRFQIKSGDGEPQSPTKAKGKGASFNCPFCNGLASNAYIEAEGTAHRIGTQLMACIAEGERGRIYLPATDEHEMASKHCLTQWEPESPIPPYSQAFPTKRHGVLTWADMFTKRQILMLDTFSGLVKEIQKEVLRDGISSGLDSGEASLLEGGNGGRAYSEAIATVLGLILGKQVNRSCAFCFWDAGSEKVQQPFAQQGIQKTWDFVESNPFCSSSGSWLKAMEYPLRVISNTCRMAKPGKVFQRDAMQPIDGLSNLMIITDPPYYANMGYADLSDFFYIWLRRAIGYLYPSIFGTMLTPKNDELAAINHRFGGDKRQAERFFINGFEKAFAEIRRVQHPDYPIAFFYAYKQTESMTNGDRVSTGWETMLEGILRAGLSITGTWPMETELTEALKKTKSSLMTSVVLVCRPRPIDASLTTVRDFRNRLRRELPLALKYLTAGNIAPVDLAQSAIGPGMAIFSEYSKVIEADGSSMPVRKALVMINEVLDETLIERESEYDPETRWILAWFEQYGMNSGPFGIAESLSKAKNTVLDSMVKTGILQVKAGKVRILSRSELPEVWDPDKEKSLVIWKATQYLIKALVDKGSEVGASELLKKIGSVAETARDLTYRIFSICERKKWAQEALAYNSLVVAWPELVKLAGQQRTRIPAQEELF